MPTNSAVLRMATLLACLLALPRVAHAQIAFLGSYYLEGRDFQGRETVISLDIVLGPDGQLSASRREHFSIERSGRNPVYNYGFN